MYIFISREVRGFLQSRHEGASRNMQKGHGRIDRPGFQGRVFERWAHEFSIESEGQGTCVHIQANTEDAFLFELLAVVNPDTVTAVS